MQLSPRVLESPLSPQIAGPHMDQIDIVAYDPRWPAMFAAEAERVRAALAATEVEIVAIAHFGSTAVPGLAAKPIIDIAVAVRSLATARVQSVAPLERIDYAYWADNPKRDRLFFVKGLPPQASRRTHHVHITEPDGAVWTQLRFRDYLRDHPDAAARYAALKRELAARHRSDREAYTDAKAAFIADIMQKARG